MHYAEFGEAEVHPIPALHLLCSWDCSNTPRSP